MSGVNGNGSISLGAYIVRLMADAGFMPSAEFHGSRIQFRRDYRQDDGTMVRVSVFLDKPVMGMDGPRLSSVSIATQLTIPPEEGAIQHLAPPEVRGALQTVLESFGASAPQPQSLRVRSCVGCGEDCVEYYIVNDDAVCVDCVAARQESST